MPRGGRRAGAGRKPGSKSRIGRGFVVELAAHRRAPALPPAIDPQEQDALAAPPDDLGLSSAAVLAWRRLAPYALKQRTLTAETTPGFSKLCQEWAYCLAFEERIQTIGIATAEADRLLKRLADHKKLLNASLGNFNLRSFGKPATSDKPKPAANPFAQFGGAR